ncbi:MAG: helix-turn-helix domain-containing protein [Clostridiales bacterium]|nr:helix-turn-helix domain-containing protein [Clostridiales bacterium]
MADMGTKEAAEKWGVTQATVAKWCREGKITPQPTQDKIGSPWHISKNAKPTKK